MNALTIAQKDLQIFFKDRSAMIQLLVLPLLFVVIFSGALSEIGKNTARSGAEQDTRIPLAVVDLDGGEAALTLVKEVNAAGGVRTELYEQAQAQALLDEQKIERLLTLPAGFSEDMVNNRTVTLVLVNHPDASSSQTEAVRLVIDGVARDMSLESQILLSLQQMGEMLASSPVEFQQAFSVERIQAQARSQFVSSNARPLVVLKQSVPAPAEESSNDQPLTMALIAVPGVAVLFVFLTAQATASSIFEEKKVGSFRRLLASPLSKPALLSGKLLPNFLMALIQMAIIFAFGTLGLRLLGMVPFPLGNSPLALALVVGTIALCSSALGILIASLAHTEAQISGVSMLLLWVMGLLGGAVLPLFLLERFFGPLPKIIPHYWAIRALQNLTIRGLGLASVTTELAVLLGFTALFIVIGLWRFDYD